MLLFSPPALRQPVRNSFVENKEKYCIFILNGSKTIFKILFETSLLFHMFPGILLFVNICTLFTEQKEMGYKCKTTTVYNFEKTVIKKEMTVLGSRFTKLL